MKVWVVTYLYSKSRREYYLQSFGISARYATPPGFCGCEQHSLFYGIYPWTEVTGDIWE